MEGVEVNAKKRKKSGWDSAPAETPVVTSVPVATAAPPQSAQSSLSSLDGTLAAQIASIRTQQTLAQQALKLSMSMGASSIPSSSSMLQPAPPAAPPVNPLANLMSMGLSAPPSIFLPPLSISTPTPVVIPDKLENRIYVGSLHYNLQQNDIHALFSVFGPIVKVDMSHDNVTNRSKGFCFVEFADPLSAEAATSMNGFELAGRKIKVGRPNGGAVTFNSSNTMGAAVSSSFSFPMTASSSGMVSGLGLGQLGSTFVTPQQQAQAHLAQLGLRPPVPPTPPPSAPLPPQSKTIRIGELRKEFSLENIKTIFQPFGAIVSCVFSSEGAPSSQDPSLVVRSVDIEYADAVSARESAAAMAGFELSALKLTVKVLSAPAPLPPPPSATTTTAAVAAATASSVSAALATSTTASTTSAPSTTTPASTSSASTRVVVSTNVMLLNLMDRSEMDDESVREDIIEEVSKYGPVQGMEVTVVEVEGVEKVAVTLHFADISRSAKVFSALNGRYFAGRPVIAKYV